MRAARLWAAAAAMLCAVPAPAQEAGLLGRTIASVAFVSDGPVDVREVGRLVELKAGEPLTEDAIRRSVQNLYATERYANVEIEGELAKPEGVDVQLRLFRAYRVAAIRFENRPVGDDALRRTLGFSVGAPYQTSEALEGVDRLKRFLTTEGFASAAVTEATEFDRARFDATVVYRIEPGPPTLLVAPIFDGDPAPFSEAALVAASKLKPGARYREERARKAAQAMQDLLASKGRLKAEVRLIGVETRARSAAPVFRIEVGPQIVFETAGVEEKRVRRDFANLLKNQVFQEDLLIRYVATLRRQYQESGYHDARVDYTINEKASPIVVTLTVQRGARKFVSALEIDGVSAFPKRRIADLMLTRPRSLLHRGRLSDSVLADDRAAVEGFYRAHGFTEAAIAPPAVSDAPRPPGGLVVRLSVVEGPRTDVRSSGVEGVILGDRAALLRKVTLKAGEPYNPQKAADDRAAIVGWYRDRGWTSAAVETQVTITPDRALADVNQSVREGPREFFGKTIVRGNTQTSTSRLLVPVRWHEGDAFSDTKMLDAQRDISRTGAFQKVNVERGPPDPSAPGRNVVIDVTPGKPLSVLYGFGYQYEDPTGDQSPYVLFGVGYNNLFGSLRSISLEARYAPETSRGRVFLNYRDPYFFGAETPLVASIFYTREPVQTIDVQRQGAFVEANRQVTSRIRIGIRSEYQRIDTGHTDPIDLAAIPPADRDIAETTLGGTLLYDTRDDIIDPHRGVFVSAFAKKAFPIAALSANARYVKAYAQISGYVPFPLGVLAASVRAGKAWVGGCSIGGEPATSGACIPIAERFFAGGRTSNRGFGYAIEGIPGETVDYSVIEVPVPAGKEGQGTCRGIDPSAGANFNCDFGPRIVGGSSTAGFDLEWRFPIAGAFGGQVFYDATQVWADGSFHLGLEKSRGLRQTVGFGLRYLTPVGPLRFEFGRVLHPRTFDVPLLLFDETSGEVSDFKPPRKVVQTEATYKLFLSIGYAF